MMTENLPDKIWLIDMGDEITWCDDPAPGTDMDANDAVGYVKAGEIERLQAELKTANSEKQRNLLLANINLKQSEALQAENAKLQSDLRKYGRHLSSCMMLDYHDERDFGCTCGYNQTLAAQEKE